MLSQHISLNTIDAWVQAVGVIRSSLVTSGGSRVTDSEYGWRVTGRYFKNYSANA